MRYKLVLILLSILLFSCEDENGSNPVDSVDKQAMLTNYADNIIIPSYAELQNVVSDLKSNSDNFIQNRNTTSLNLLRESFENSYIKWQFCSAFEFGPAEAVLLRQSLNTFPTSTIQIESNIETGEYNLGSASNFSAKGFPAIDYLLFWSNDAEVIESFSDENRRDYLNEIVTEIYDLVNNIAGDWVEYREQFIQNDGNSVGSSLSLLVNQFNYDYELLKRVKVGIPLGILSLDKLPENCEGYYSGITNDLMKNHLMSLENIFSANSDYSDKTDNLKEYLDELSTTKDGELLSETITGRFTESLSLINQLNTEYSKAIFEQEQLANDLYSHLQRTVVYIKTDMTSAIGVQINYQDNDGD